MIRILHIVGVMDRGGIETFIMNVYRTIDKSKVQFDFLVHSKKQGAYDKEIIELGGNIYYSIPRKSGLKKNIKSLEEFFKKHKYDIVHQHLSSLTYITPLQIAKKYNVPCRVVHVHSTMQSGLFVHKYIHKYNKFKINRYATNFFACSTPAALWGFPKSITNKKKHEVIKNGIHTQTFLYDKSEKESLRKKHGIPSHSFIIGHIGRFHPLKNHNFLIDVFEEFLKLHEDSYLVLVGDGRQKKMIEDRVKNKLINERVIFAGVQSNVKDCLNLMDYFIFPSKFEGLGLALIEAQATGLRSLASKNVIPEEVDVTGLVRFVSLKKSAKYWALEIFRTKEYTRQNQTSKILSAGYSVEEVSRYLEKFYTRNYQN